MVHPETISPLAEMPVYNSKKKKRRLIIITVSIAGLLVVTGAAILGIWFTLRDNDTGILLGKTCLYNGVKYKDGKSFDATDGCNTCICKNRKSQCTLMACERLTSTTEGWNEYDDQDDRISFKYPQDWIIEEDDYDPLSYKVTATNPQGYAITFEGTQGEYGYTCFYPDSGSPHVDSNLGKITFDIHYEFEHNYSMYRIAPSRSDTTKQIICQYDDEVELFLTQISQRGFISYTIPDETPDGDMVNILNLILWYFQS